jgi:DNA-binding response OmpR family regulator
MKQVLVIDESPLLREYLRTKLSDNDLEVSVAVNGLDGIAKIRNLLPDLIILDYHLSRQSALDVLKEKKKNPNAASIPVIITAQKIDQKRIIELVQYNIKKVFTKPIKIDALFTTLSELLGVSFDIDQTPCIIEAHVNDDIIFIEIARGLNREKLDLLRYKIIELINLYDIRIPKLIVMLSDLTLSYGDGPNLQKLLDTVLQASRVKHHYIRVLTNDPFVRKFILGRKEYADIEVTANLQFALDGLLSELDPRMEFGERKAQIIGDRVLAAEESTEAETVQLKFDGELQRPTTDLGEIKEYVKNLKIAIVDDDFVIQELVRNTFETLGAQVRIFSDGEEYLKVAGTEELDLVLLDLMMPKVDGFTVLRELKARDIDQTVIVLSAVTQREAVVKAFQGGIKSYLVKPLKPQDILKKTIEILKPNF